MLEIERLFIEVKAIREKYDLIAKITGENFNVFQILGLQSSEVRLHSSFIAQLLNIQGSHDQGDKFLSIFLKQLEARIPKIKEFAIPLSKTHVEFFTTKITVDGESGGRIDILLEDITKKYIIIENKIYASDQPKQLKRYKNFDQKSILLYLNLFGTKPLDESCDGLVLDHDYWIISYEKHIITWLEACLKEASTLPIIRETIHQYINLIKRLTNQSTYRTMNTEIIKLFSEKPEYFKIVPSILSAYNKIKEDISKQFFEMLETKLNEIGFEIKIENTGYKIQLTADEGDSGFFFSYRIVNLDNKIRCFLWQKQKWIKKINPIIARKDETLIYERYFPIFKKFIEEPKESEYSLCYYNSFQFKENKKLHEIDVNRYINIYDRGKCADFINELLNIEMEVFNRIEAEINAIIFE